MMSLTKCFELEHRDSKWPHISYDLIVPSVFMRGPHFEHHLAHYILLTSKNTSSCFSAFLPLELGQLGDRILSSSTTTCGVHCRRHCRTLLTHVVREINTQYLHQAINQASQACCFVLCIFRVLNNVLIHVLIFLHWKKENVYIFCKLISYVNFFNFFSLFKCLVKP
jgi:hypothetical protein